MKRKPSVILSLVLCVILGAVLAVWAFTFPFLFEKLYTAVHRGRLSAEDVAYVGRAVTIAFYTCLPFALAALGMLIKLLMNLLRGRVFVPGNVLLLRWLSWCCFAVFVVCCVQGMQYFPLFAVAVAMGVVGTLLQAVKSSWKVAVGLREDNDLTI